MKSSDKIKLSYLCLLWILSLNWVIVLSQPKKAILLNTLELTHLNWTKFPNRDDRGWKIYTPNMDEDDRIVSMYGSCDVDLSTANNWLRTPYIKKDVAKRLYVEIQFTMRECNKDPETRQEGYLFCKETINLMYFETDLNTANATWPPWQEEGSYTKLDAVASHHRYVKNPDWKTDLNKETLSVPITKRGVYFALQDKGACVAMYQIRVYYITCAGITRNYAYFPETPTGPNVTSIEQVPGLCVLNADTDTAPKFLCKGDGTWQYLTGTCECRPGYQPAPNGNQHCEDCPVGTYKSVRANTVCSRCPRNSQSLKQGSTECACKSGYYRAPGEGASVDCTRPPGSVVNLRVTKSSQTSLTLNWDPPADLGGRTDTSYRLRCYLCAAHDSDQCDSPCANQLAPTTSTSYEVGGLDAHSHYRLVVFAVNGVSPDEASQAFTEVFGVTVAELVEQLQVSQRGAHFLLVTWVAPAGANMKDYEVQYGPVKDATNVTMGMTQNTRYRLEPLQPATVYLVKVRAWSMAGWGGWASTREMTSEGSVTQDPVREGRSSSNKDAVTAGVVVAAVVAVSGLAVLVVLFCRRNRTNCNEKPVNPPASHYNHAFSMPLFPAVLGQVKTTKTYVDPHTYEDPTQAVREFTREIDAACITIESVIGGGEFGDVCKGRLRLPNKAEKHVAIKTLKPGASDKNRLDFLTEASIMGQFNNANVIFLEGVVTCSNPIMIVTEYMENGSLDVWLRNNDGKSTQKQLLGILKGIASGMGYLADMGYVHRDLAARNILVDANLNCKVADFGLSREVENDTTDGAYTTKGGKIPVRWTAPEAIAYRKFTTASDVWSFGVVMWEVISYGERPYWNWSNHDVIRAVDRGYRLPPPMECPESVYQLMLDCWQKERNHRPRFTSIVKTLDKLMTCRDLLTKMAKPRSISVLSESGAPDLSRLSGVPEWLAALKLERYTPQFLAAGLSSLEQVCRLQPRDLSALGVQLAGHQKKLFTSIQALHAQQQHTRHTQLAQHGFLV